MENHQESPDSTRLQRLIEGFTADQLAYLAVRPFVRWDKQAAKKIGIPRESVSRWENKADIDEALRLMRVNGVSVASQILLEHLPLAAHEITKQVTHRNVNVRYRASADLMDRAMGKAITRAEFSGPGGGPIETQNANSPEHNRAISSLADAIGALIPGEGGTPDGPLDAAEQEAVVGSAE